jgi:hypothetical protein
LSIPDRWFSGRDTDSGRTDRLEDEELGGGEVLHSGLGALVRRVWRLVEFVQSDVGFASGPAGDEDVIGSPVPESAPAIEREG